jgi:hypothetical protein
MTTTTTPFDDLAYTQIFSGTDGLISNSSNFTVRVAMEVAAPAADTDNFFFLDAHKAFQITGGAPSGFVYMRAENGKEGQGTSVV